MRAARDGMRFSPNSCARKFALKKRKIWMKESFILTDMHARLLISTLTYFSIHGWSLSGALFSLLAPQGLPHMDPGWAHRLESALQLFCQNPFTYLISNPCRLFDWVRQSSWVRVLSKRGAGEKVSGYPLPKATTPLPFSLILSLQLFTIHNVRHKWFCAAHHNRAHHSAAAGS